MATWNVWSEMLSALQAVDADGSLTDAEKAYQKANVKCTALVAAATNFHAFPWPAYTKTLNGVTWTITLTKLAVVKATGATLGNQPVFQEDPTGNCLGIWVTALKNGVAVRWTFVPFPCFDTNSVREDVPFVWQSPPALISDGTGTITSPSGRTGCKFDLKALAQQLFENDIVAGAR